MKTISYISPLLPSLDEYTSLLEEVWESHYLTNNGPKCLAFENALRQYLHADNVACFVNGHMALDCAIKAFDLKGEVITTPFTFASTMQAIIANGLTPVFCDIDPVTLCIDATKVEALITDKTCAIMPVHVYGRACNLDALDAIAKKHDLKLIYDAAHTFGCTTGDTALANHGDVSMISFHATKVFNSIEGGCLVFKDAAYYDKFKQVANFGMNSGTVAFDGNNSKMNEFQACMGLCNLKLVDDEIAKRKAIFAKYDAAFASVPGLTIPPELTNLTKYNYSYYALLIDSEKYGLTADELFDKLNAENIIARRYFTPALNRTPIVENYGFDCGSTPVAWDVTERIIALPVHGQMTDDDVERIIDAVKRFSCAQ